MNQPAAPEERIDGIAIIGMSGRFPGARNTSEFWQNLRNGVESISTFSAEELARQGFPASVLNEPNFVSAGGVLDDVDRFDAVFFGLNARDAEIMDPQQRLFLECSWESLEDAGYNPEMFAGSIGVYAGTSQSSYLYQIYADAERAAHLDQMQLQILNDKDHLTTHVSYKLNLTGPSVVVQSACSTSLVAISIACDALWNHRCDMALAGGVAISIPQRKGYTYMPGGILSPDGHCRAFDAAAHGTVGGSGVGVVVLRRLSEAILAGDRIYAVIRGAALNNDGSFKVGYTAPSIPGQAAVIAMAQAMAGVNPETISYIEAHGTGTQLGDPIEVAALTEAFRMKTEKKGFCAIGSVKTNVGHLDPAAGVTGLIKTALALQHKEIPASLHFQKPNPEIDFENSPFYVNTRTSAWPADGGPRRAGVSSFGIGGTNAHCVLEEAPVCALSGESRKDVLLLLSAKSKAALEAQTANFASYLKTNSGSNLADVAFVTQVGRKAFHHRRMLLCGSDEGERAVSALESLDPECVFSNAGDAKERPVVFLFPGQGAQYVNMARGLYETESVFRAEFDQCCDLLLEYLGTSLREVLYPEGGVRGQASEQLTRTAFAQPALFAIEYSLAALWMSWGIRPQAMIGHSIGEYVAACLAGVLSMEDALKLVAARGRLMDGMSPGSMLSVPLSETEARSALGGNLSVAAINSPSSCVISGPTNGVEDLERRFAARGLPCRRLVTSHAFHSAMMDAAVGPFVEEVRGVSLNAPSIPYLSNVTGTWITAEEATSPEYWGTQMRKAVRFADCLAELLKEPDWVLLEVGPGRTLCSLLRQQNVDVSQRPILPSLGAAPEKRDDATFFLETLGRLWLSGAPVDWVAFSASEKRCRIPLPTYPFERQRYWIGIPDKLESAGAAESARRRPFSDWFYIPTWSQVESANAKLDAPLNQAQDWLIFCDSQGVGTDLAKLLKSDGNTVTTVRAGDRFGEAEEGTYLLRPGESGDYDKLIESLAAKGRLPQQIAHLWLLTGNSEEQPLDSLLDRGFRSLTFLVQAIGRQSLSEDMQIGVVSDRLQALLDEDTISPAKATVLGPCRVIPQEYPHITCRSIDVMTEETAEEIARQVRHELTAEPYSDVVAYRSGRRYLQSWEQVRLDDEDHAPLLEEDGVYLITGAFGGIGLTLAQRIAKGRRTKLVLIGRSALPERSAWQEWLDQHDVEDVTSVRIKAIQEIESAGATVMVACADVSDRAQMAAVVEEARRSFGAINGIIHSAGIAGGGMIQLKSQKVADSVLAPKVQGTMVLDELLNDQPLDFFLICSSLASVYGGFGQMDYCAANNFLDAYAQANTRAGRLTVAVNWDTWSEVGMAVKTEVPAELEQSRRKSLERGISPDEGADAFIRILNSGRRQVLVCTTDLQANLEAGGALTTAQVEQEPSALSTAPKTTHPRPALGTPYAPPRSQTEDEVAAVWQDLLGVAPVGIHDNFFELGGHSLLAIQLISQLRGLYEVEVSVQNLFDAPTVAKLAERIDASREESDDMEAVARLLEQVEQLSESEVQSFLDDRHPPPAPARLDDAGTGPQMGQSA